MLVIGCVAFVAHLAETDKVHSLLISLVSDKNPNPEASIGELLLMQGEKAIGIVQVILSSAMSIVIGLVVLFSAGSTKASGWQSMAPS